MVRKPGEKRGLRFFGSFGVVAALTVLGLAAIGVVVVLMSKTTPDAAAPQSGKAPQVRQLDRESLRSGVGDPNP